ncbi:ComF family protein [Bradyrhizobium sp.]|uniref:ComF family protein n=1 Tax=Bradyrhizobium sp. TaxID=376 RepID=UPI0039E37708
MTTTNFVPESLSLAIASDQPKIGLANLIISNHQRFWNDIAIFGDYRPWGVHRAMGGDRSNYPEYSGKILDLKDGKDGAAAYFANLMAPALGDNFAVAVVPGHDPARVSPGLRTLAAEIAKGGRQRLDASGVLLRTKRIDKLAHGGDRSEQVHLESVSVGDPRSVAMRDILLLDDVTKTGHSLHACRRLLAQAGARSVVCAAIGLV